MATPIPKNDARLSVWRAAAATRGDIVRTIGDGAHAVGIATDTRALAAGNAFVALRGERHDGHDHLALAVENGAKLLIVQKGHGRAIPEGNIDVVEVADSLVALGDLARAHLRSWRRGRYGREAARVIAITGSAGKTTTKEICAALLSEEAPALKSMGNLNNRVGVPMSAFTVSDDDRFAVFEVGMSVPGEIEQIASIVEADVALITNIGSAHAGGVGGARADVAREKGALFEALGANGVAIVNVDDEAARGQIARSAALRSETFGRAENARYRLLDRTPRESSGATLLIEKPAESAESKDASVDSQETVRIDFPLVGEAAALDFVAALAAAEAALGHSLKLSRIEQAMRNLAVPDGRLRIHTLRDETILIDDSYNANPESVRAALGTLDEVAGKRRKVVVFGEMKELGNLATRAHEQIGEQIAAHGVALAVGCGGAEVNSALRRAEMGGVQVLFGHSAEGAAQMAIADVLPGDVVLVKASRSVGAERVVEALIASRGGPTP